MLLTLLWVGLVSLVGAAPAQGLSADEVVQSALNNDPDYLAAEAAVQEAEGLLRAATALQNNPTVYVEMSVTDPRFGLQVQQPISVTGEGFARRAAAEAQLRAAEAERARAALQCAADARSAWAVAAAAESRVSLTAQALIQARARRELTEARVQAGDASELSARLMRLAEVEAAAAHMQAQNEATAARVGLAQFVAGAATAALAGEVRSAAPPSTGPGERADLRAAEDRVAAAEATLSAERAAMVPMLSVGAFVEHEAGTTFAGPSLQMNVPFWKLNPDGRASAKRALVVAEAEARAVGRVAEAEQSATERALSAATDTREGLVRDPGAEARAAIASIDDAAARGELDVATATLLRQQVLDAWGASITLELAYTQAEIAALLAASDVALLPAELREVSP
ncbi:MAG: TolC family protein [Deltaproteobacteria bacterium]|nr:TolC family protein [Deltaproteobacteria bacterium]